MEIYDLSQQKADGICSRKPHDVYFFSAGCRLALFHVQYIYKSSILRQLALRNSGRPFDHSNRVHEESKRHVGRAAKNPQAPADNELKCRRIGHYSDRERDANVLTLQ